MVSSSHITTQSPCKGACGPGWGIDIDGDSWDDPASMGCDEPSENPPIGPLQLALYELPDVVTTGFTIDAIAVVIGHAAYFTVNFGDNTIYTNTTLCSHSWSAPGHWPVTLTAFNDSYPNGVAITQMVQTVSMEATTIHVSPAGNDENNGLSWADAKHTIQGGVDAQVYLGGRVWITNGTYSLSSEILVTNTITIASVNGAANTIVDGGGFVRCFNLGSNTCTLRGLTISSGKSSYGGGVYCESKAPVIEDCVLFRNIATGRGGGIYKGMANNCIFTNNSARDGGGQDQGTANNCTFSGNTASFWGGGISSGPANNCTLSNNTASRGGGLYSGTAVNCTFSNNTASTGGGMYSGEAYSCTFSDNTATEEGGGGGNITANNCSFFENSATSLGGGSYSCTTYNCTFFGNTANEGGGMYEGSANNCIVWNNSATTSNDLYETKAHYSCSPDVTHGTDGCITNNPLFVNGPAGSFNLNMDSPCIDAGDNTLTVGSEDIALNPRIANGKVDMGAFEYVYTYETWSSSISWDGANANPNADPDGDNISNMNEFIAGTHPLDANSLLTLISTSRASVNNIALHWQTQPGKSYSIQSAPSPTNTYHSAANNITTSPHTVPITGSSHFYRIEME